MKTFFACLLSILLATFISAMFVDEGELKWAQKMPRTQRKRISAMLGIVAVLAAFVAIFISTNPKGGKDGDAIAGTADSVVVIGSFRSYGLDYPIRYNAATASLILSDDYEVLRGLLDSGRVVVVFIGSENRLAGARRVDEKNEMAPLVYPMSLGGGTTAAVIYEVGGETFKTNGTAGDDRALIRRWRRAGIRFIVPESE